MTARPLDGIRVLDFTRVVAGPSCSKALVDLGAEVIKVEPPEGDTTRFAHPRVDGMAVYFAQQNAGKRCVSLDLATEAGRDIARQLADQVDIIVENYRPGVAERLGVGYEEVCQTNPGVIYCSISGYGQTGPASQRRAYAPVIHAELGLLEMTARRRDQPILNEIAGWADLQAGLQGALAITAALHHRTTSGVGQHIDVAMADAVLQMTEWSAVELNGGEQGEFHIFGGANAPVLTLGDGTTAVIPGDPVTNWKAWLRVMGKRDGELADDPRFVDRPTRQAHRADMLAILNEWAATIPDFDSLEQAIDVSRLAAGQVKPISDVLTDEWAEHRNSVVDVGEDQPILVPKAAFRYSDLEVGAHGHPGLHGDQNRSVLSELLGLSAAEIDKLEEAGAVVSNDVTANR